MNLITRTILGLGLLAAAGCTRPMEDLLHDPEAVTTATSGSFLNTAVLNGVNIGLSRSHRLNNELMQTTVSLTDGQFHRYVLIPSESDYLWNNYYLTLTNVQDMYNRAREASNRNHMAAALTLRAWLYQNLTDTYGDIPYSQALKGYPEYIISPRFDTQEQIYADLVSQLDSANALYEVSKSMAPGTDVLYGAEQSAAGTLKWKRFTNSLRLRLLMRGEAKSPAFRQQIRNMLANPAQYPLMSTVDESATLKFTGTNPLLNPFADDRDYDFNGSNAYAEFFIGLLNSWQDPRLDVWATKVSGRFVGVPSGYSLGDAPKIAAIASSRINKTLKTSPLLGTIMQYAETEFLLAEAALKGYSADSPKDHYEKGIRASMGYWGAVMPANYLTRPGVAYTGSFEQIMNQKYVSLFFTEMQQWAEYRRTGFPVLPKGPGVENNGQMPARLAYPLSVQSLNRANYDEAAARIGGDNINAKVWWAN
ncbi:SusD/RagB family nutrient-binding outer membrane lipoprotein [Spirosoma sordidisoli]|uniref:SusD/RagB family nutrient-binding outer membrane lipoprotein n=1 Tax=Spirosoma sordidisoli TaxID=2502893 RepID=A0A4Q2UGE9_9BACT|nr:SusD/RagB family nutrient-binding outer membrane lipoprotein [Spirosoma sordidisoli]RYC68204.1 SusD/RagB family nutrient-binding outer membrane lipoprotein [Spirosoma sordidisoli]